MASIATALSWRSFVGHMPKPSPPYSATHTRASISDFLPMTNSSHPTIGPIVFPSEEANTEQLYGGTSGNRSDFATCTTQKRGDLPNIKVGNGPAGGSPIIQEINKVLQCSERLGMSQVLLKVFVGPAISVPR